MEKNLGKLNVIAEDLGLLTDSVIELVEESGFPGMKVLQFAFDENEDSSYLPHRYERNCIVYTGTHDNEINKRMVPEFKPCMTGILRKHMLDARAGMRQQLCGA